MSNQISKIPNRHANKRKKNSPPEATQFYVKFIKEFNIEFQPVSV